MFFTQIYIYDNSNKNIYMFIYKKSLRKCLRLFHKTFSNYQETQQKELYLLFEKSGNFSKSQHRDRFDSSPPPVCFHSLLKDPPPPSTTNPGFPTGVENMGGGGCANTWGKHGGLKILLKNTCGGVHFIEKLLAISLQACKFTKNELLYSYF